MSVKLSEVIAPSFHELTRSVLDHQYTHYNERGGRGSTKSSWVSIIVPLLIMQNPYAHAVVMRKVANTIKDSVFAQYCWGIDALGVNDYWTARKSPFELTYKPTGQKIMFRGADDPMKIKSIKVPFGYIAVTHFEELDQFAGRQEVRTILQSTMRGGNIFWNFETYNPPISRDNWVNLDSLEERPGRICHKSTYLDVPSDWLGEQFIVEAEHLKQTDFKAYQHEYLGIPVGTGGNVFDKIELRTITDEEVKRFDHIFMGVDWGFYPDPFVFIRLHYDRQHETIYLIDEIVNNKTSNDENARLIREKGYTDGFITCDSAEPKSVADFRSCGIAAQGAVKGPGSVEYGMKWLQIRKFVIDLKRTPKTGNEIINYQYERNKYGEIISGYPDANNHGIDAIRYSLERVFRKYGSSA